MDVITISSSDDEKEDPLSLDTLPSRIKHQLQRTASPALDPEIVIVVNTPPKEQKDTVKRIKLIPVLKNEPDTNPPKEAALRPSGIKTEIAVNGFHMSQPHKRKHGTSPTPNVSSPAATLENASDLGHNMETNQSDSLFRMFTDLCKEVGDSGPEMDKIISKAWQCYYRTKIEFRTSREYIRLVEKNLTSVRKDPSNMYSYMLEVCTELKSRKTMKTKEEKADKVTVKEPEAKRQKTSYNTSETPSTSRDTSDNCKTTNNGEDASDSEPENEEDEKKQMHIKRLSKHLRAISKQISKFEMAEVDWDEDNDSAYIALQTWKQRAVKIYKKICQLTGEHDKSTYRVQLHNLDSTSRFPEVDRCIRKFVNSTGQFPDFQDVLKIYKEHNEKHQLGLTPIQLHSCAADIFQLIGNELQRKRKLDNWDLHCDFLRDEPDPADEDSELQNQLQDNRKKFISTVNQIVDEFAQKQQEQKLEAVEVPEEEANKSEDDNSDAEEDEEEEDSELVVNEGGDNWKGISPATESDDNTNDSKARSKVLNHTNDSGETTVNVLTAVDLKQVDSSLGETDILSHKNTSMASVVAEEMTSGPRIVDFETAADDASEQDKLENGTGNECTTSAVFATKTSAEVTSTKPTNKGEESKMMVPERDSSNMVFFNEASFNLDHSVSSLGSEHDVVVSQHKDYNLDSCVTSVGQNADIDSSVPNSVSPLIGEVITPLPTNTSALLIENTSPMSSLEEMTVKPTVKTIDEADNPCLEMCDTEKQSNKFDQATVCKQTNQISLIDSCSNSEDSKSDLLVNGQNINEATGPSSSSSVVLKLVSNIESDSSSHSEQNYHSQSSTVDSVTFQDFDSQNTLLPPKAEGKDTTTHINTLLNTSDIEMQSSDSAVKILQSVAMDVVEGLSLPKVMSISADLNMDDMANSECSTAMESTSLLEAGSSSIIDYGSDLNNSQTLSKCFNKAESDTMLEECNILVEKFKNDEPISDLTSQFDEEQSCLKIVDNDVPNNKDMSISLSKTEDVCHQQRSDEVNAPLSGGGSEVPFTEMMDIGNVANSTLSSGVISSAGLTLDRSSMITSTNFMNTCSKVSAPSLSKEIEMDSLHTTVDVEMGTNTGSVAEAISSLIKSDNMFECTSSVDSLKMISSTRGSDSEDGLPQSTKNDDEDDDDDDDDNDNDYDNGGDDGGDEDDGGSDGDDGDSDTTESLTRSVKRREVSLTKRANSKVTEGAVSFKATFSPVPVGGKEVIPFSNSHDCVPTKDVDNENSKSLHSPVNETQINVDTPETKDDCAENRNVSIENELESSPLMDAIDDENVESGINNNSTNSVASLQVDKEMGTSWCGASLSGSSDVASPDNNEDDGATIQEDNFTNNFLSVQVDDEVGSLPDTIQNDDEDPLEKEMFIDGCVDDANREVPSLDIIEDNSIARCVKNNKRERCAKRKHSQISVSPNEAPDISEFLSVEVQTEDREILAFKQNSKENNELDVSKFLSVVMDSEVSKEPISVVNLDDEDDDVDDDDEMDTLDVSKFVDVEIKTGSPTSTTVVDEKSAVGDASSAHKFFVQEDSDPDILIEDVPVKPGKRFVAVKMESDLKRKQKSLGFAEKEDIDISKFLTVEVNADSPPPLVIVPKTSSRQNVSLSRRSRQRNTSNVSVYSCTSNTPQRTRSIIDRGTALSSTDLGKFVAVKIGLSKSGNKMNKLPISNQSLTPGNNRSNLTKQATINRPLAQLPPNYFRRNVGKTTPLVSKTISSTSSVNSSLLRLSNQGCLTVERLQPPVQVRNRGRTKLTGRNKVTKLDTSTDDDIIVLD